VTESEKAKLTQEHGLPATVYTVTPDASISDVARLMVSQDVGDVIVVESQKPVGIMTDRDIVVRVTGAGLEASEVRVREVMSQPPVTISRSEEARVAIGLMGRHGIRRLPIVDEEGRLVSILTMDDIILFGLDGQPELQHIVRRQLRVGETAKVLPAQLEAASAQPQAASRGEEALLSGPVTAVAHPSVIVPMEPSHIRRRRRTWLDVARVWYYRNRPWIVILLLLSLAGAGVVMVTDYFGRAFYNYNPTYYEPKELERQRQLLEKGTRK
jgi:CBS domain-containing protein